MSAWSRPASPIDPGAQNTQVGASPLRRPDGEIAWPHPGPPSCPTCLEALLPDVDLCPRCLNKVEGVKSQQPAASEAPPAPAVPARKPGSTGAIYTIESPVRCPECEKEIRAFRVLRVLRTQASFTSTLPRKGYVVVCPECERLLSAELSGLV